jgi:GT2 family glycosyltransferase
MTLQVSVIVPTYDDWVGLQACLDCLAGQTLPVDRYEVIVANNNALPEVPGTLRLPGNARVVHAPTPGSYAARNLALEVARGDFLFFTDSDCQPDRRWIEAGLDHLAVLGPTGRVGGRIQLFPNGPTWTAAELYDRIHGLRQHDYVRYGWAATANLATRRAAFDLAGPFRADLFSGGDVEWNLRAKGLGSEIVFAPDMLVRHPARASFADLAKKRRRHLGGHHQKTVLNLHQGRKTRSHKPFFQPNEIRRCLSYPGLSDRDYARVLWVAFRLAIVSLDETIRLRYLSGRPKRS